MTEGVGILDLSKSYGKLNNKFLYICHPDDKSRKSLLIPYSRASKFDKSHDHHYVKYANGIIIQNFGPIDNLSNMYEYMLHSKHLNISLNAHNKIASTSIKSYNSDIIEQITSKYNLPRRIGHIFTIDSISTTDYDDAISVSNNKISIYITNVPIILDYLNLWGIISNRVSSIYLPDKKCSMLPKIIEDMCSLSKGTHNICFVLDLYIDDNKNIYDKQFSICNVKISRNYTYDDTKIVHHPDYTLLKKYLSFTDSHELVSKLMILFNKECAQKITNNAIYKPHNIYNPITVDDYIYIYRTCSSKPYTSDICDYLHITSPIRRLVDILNMYSFTRVYIDYSETAKDVFNMWYDNIDKINKHTRDIKKIQRICTLHYVFEQNKHRYISGRVFNRNEDMYEVFLPELHIFTKVSLPDRTLDESKTYTFKLYMIIDELYKKIHLELIY
jgi:exoribonuclease R